VGLPDGINFATGYPSGGPSKKQPDNNVHRSPEGAPPSPQSLGYTLDRNISFVRSIDLLGNVLEYAHSLYGGVHRFEDKVKSLDAPLQSLLAELLQYTTDCWEDHCETIGVCLW
jgi:hypothetical protein